MSSPRVVVDTNVLISAGLLRASVPRRILDWILDHGVLLTSSATEAEFASRFVARSKFDRYAPVSERSAFVAAVVARAERVRVRSRLSVCSDPDDDRFVELAVDGQAACIVTGNTRDFPGAYSSIPVLTPARFAARYVDR